MIHQAMLYVIPLFAVEVRHATASQAGINVASMSLAVVASTLLAGMHIKKSGKYKSVMTIGAVLVTVGPSGFAALCMLSVKDGGYEALDPFIVFPSAFGFQLISAVSIVALIAAYEQSKLATFTGYITCMSYCSSYGYNI